jgi:hypothetical protein
MTRTRYLAGSSVQCSSEQPCILLASDLGLNSDTAGHAMRELSYPSDIFSRAGSR